MRAEVVDLLRAEAPLHVPMDFDGVCTKGKGKGPIARMARAKPRATLRRVKKPESVTSASNLDISVKDCAVCKKRMAEKGGNKEKIESTAAVQGATVAVQGVMIETWSTLKLTVFSRSVKPLLLRPMCQRKAQQRHGFRLTISQ